VLFHVFWSLVLELTHEAKLLVNAPRSLLKIVLSNLIKNAFHYTTTGRIRFIVKADRLIIEDTGIGISSDMLSHVTEPSVRGKQSQGLGIGLAIVKMICERVGWQFEIQSGTEKGTVVQLIFSKNS
jgi:signal transduction histidine kinase